MYRIVKTALWVAAGLGILVAGAAVTASVAYENKRSRNVPVTVAPVAYADGAEVRALGKYLFDSRGCADCHGADGKGARFLDDAESGFRVTAPNITPAGVVAKYTESDWVRIVRHGVKPDGTPAFVMPSQDYNRLTDSDLAALVAYVRSLAPTDGPAAQFEVPFIVKALYAAGQVHDAAELIDHTLPPSQPVAVAVSVEHGRYVAQMCTGCHGANYSGGPIPGAPPSWPPASNLTSGAGSALPTYKTGSEFTAMLRTGKRPDGSAVSEVMPFKALAALNDVDAAALYLYLKSLPPRDGGQR
jgi:mono/diheme cytochrome c family protein